MAAVVLEVETGRRVEVGQQLGAELQLEIGRPIEVVQQLEVGRRIEIEQ